MTDLIALNKLVASTDNARKTGIAAGTGAATPGEVRDRRVQPQPDKPRADPHRQKSLRLQLLDQGQHGVLLRCASSQVQSRSHAKKYLRNIE